MRCSIYRETHKRFPKSVASKVHLSVMAGCSSNLVKSFKISPVLLRECTSSSEYIILWTYRGVGVHSNVELVIDGVEVYL